MSTEITKKVRFNLRDKFGDWWEGTTKTQRIIFRFSVIAFFYILPFLDNPIFGTTESDFASVLFYPMGMYAIMAIGLNIIVGKSGILDLGYVAFFAIGAYAMAILGTRYNWNTWEAMPIGILLAMFAGVLLGFPTLRLRGDYLAIVTMGFGEIIRICALNLGSLTNGPNGIAGVPMPPPFFGLEDRKSTRLNSSHT